MRFYVYALIDGRNDEIFYIGKGCNERMYKHVQLAKRNAKLCNRNPKLYNKIKKILQDGCIIKYNKIFESDCESETLDKEKEVIKNIGLENLTNLTSGGEGTTYPNGFTEEHKRKMSEAKKGKLPANYDKFVKARKESFKDPKTFERISKKLKLFYVNNSSWNKGKEMSDEYKLKQSEAHKGMVFTEDHKENISKGLTGRKLSDEQKRKIGEQNAKVQIGKRHIYNEELKLSAVVHKDKMESFIAEGWKQGRKRFV